MFVFWHCIEMSVKSIPWQIHAKRHSQWSMSLAGPNAEQPVVDRKYYSKYCCSFLWYNSWMRARVKRNSKLFVFSVPANYIAFKNRHINRRHVLLSRINCLQKHVIFHVRKMRRIRQRSRKSIRANYVVLDVKRLLSQRFISGIWLFLERNTKKVCCHQRPNSSKSSLITLTLKPETRVQSCQLFL